MEVEEEFLRLTEEVKRCTKCDLHESRKNVVVGEGPTNALVMLVGEAPGYWEDLQGKPFVGAAGKFLDKLLVIAGLSRKDVYITNVVKCRPPGNREPKPEEIKACVGYLNKQISLIKPKIICALGNFAASYLLGKFGFNFQSMGKVHGETFEVNQLKIIPLYHPATALYKPPMRKVLEEDWKKVGVKIKSLKETFR
ncbi:uracil-DNA glycosylase [Candidatus Bathyarchaeota archaeon]|mgnify:CR=1 FL=1|nr:MAG: uracil-DNA glycosylase [Candidatus Bathyarchaeota archaeon]